MIGFNFFKTLEDAKYPCKRTSMNGRPASPQSGRQSTLDLISRPRDFRRTEESLSQERAENDWNLKRKRRLDTLLTCFGLQLHTSGSNFY